MNTEPTPIASMTIASMTIDWTLACRCGSTFTIPGADRPTEVHERSSTRCPHCGTVFGFYVRHDGTHFAYLTSGANTSAPEH